MILLSVDSGVNARSTLSPHSVERRHAPKAVRELDQLVSRSGSRATRNHPAVLAATFLESVALVVDKSVFIGVHFIVYPPPH